MDLYIIAYLIIMSLAFSFSIKKLSAQIAELLANQRKAAESQNEILAELKRLTPSRGSTL